MLIGVLAAPRPIPTVDVTMSSLRANWPDAKIICFAEPGCNFSSVNWEHEYTRPGTMAGSEFQHSPEGRFGNFQNWIQTAKDLLWLDWDESPNATIMICEDDLQLTEGIGEYVESCLWPAVNCGVVSLYCPPLRHYQTGTATLAETELRHSGPSLTPRNNLCGALCLIFPRSVLSRIVNHTTISGWGGSHQQVRDGANPWDRKAIDTWLGRTILELGYTAWHFRPSFANHYSPLGPNVSNSSMGNGFNRGPRQTKCWAGIHFNPTQWSVPKTVVKEIL